ncbi:MAG: DUF1080 domain-containing protein [Planctomycetes bacterium]|nr:DUF1080 domain-containing protein [Planctomycetota bacterium]HPF13411.1 DUF1080 domain-containing protein [Planctomycetota bacterium]HRV82892.1 DUF1080 domain-containing protein [Planctomycetota bacterium]
MNLTYRFVLLAALALGACHSPAQTLWNGGDPLKEGWSMAGPGSFIVEGNELRTTGGMGLLWYTREEFGDFRLDLQWKVQDPANNSGVFVRFPDPGVDPWVAVNGGYELQICDEDGEKTKTGSVYSFQGPTAVPTRPTGEWNDYSIEVVGQQYTVTINGQVVNRFQGERALRGYIGLQNHDDGSPVRFRNIRVTQL